MLLRKWPSLLIYCIKRLCVTAQTYGTEIQSVSSMESGLQCSSSYSRYHHNTSRSKDWLTFWQSLRRFESRRCRSGATISDYGQIYRYSLLSLWSSASKIRETTRRAVSRLFGICWKSTVYISSSTTRRSSLRQHDQVLDMLLVHSII